MQATHIINLKQEESEEIQTGFKNLLKEFYSHSRDKNLLVKNYIYILLVKAREYFLASVKHEREHTPRSLLIAQQFKSLVEKNFMTIHSVADYAGMMNMTAKHLGDSVKESLGKTPGELIQEMIVLEAKVLLRQTQKTIAEIAFDLSFEEQSYFSRFFRKHTEMTPQEFRANL
jgi:AraC family transcriptional activator of pobA